MKTLSCLAVLVLVAAGCTSIKPASSPNTATAELKNASGQTVGNAKLDQLPGGTRVVLEMRGIPPGPHGVHIHEVGKCEPPAFTSAGGHFNPSGKRHGALNPQGPHAGDLPNITVAQDGSGRLDSMADGLTLNPGPMSLMDADGSALVVHAGPDDFKTDPAGNSGARIACGVIVKPR